jgi:hypothetical protein
MKDPRRRPESTAILFVTVYDASEEVLAGAAIPVSRLSFPFRFQIKADNAVSNRREEFLQALAETDLNVVVKVCSDGSPNLSSMPSPSGSRQALLRTCRPSLQARGVAKLLRLRDRPVRAPLAIVLE